MALKRLDELVKFAVLEHDKFDIYLVTNHSKEKRDAEIAKYLKSLPPAVRILLIAMRIARPVGISQGTCLKSLELISSNRERAAAVRLAIRMVIQQKGDLGQILPVAMKLFKGKGWKVPQNWDILLKAQTVLDDNRL